jgi:hypothetical protein
MEPSSALSTIGPILKAAKTIEELLSAEEQLTEDDAKYYNTYLDVAKNAIKGLEAEYFEILIDAAQCLISDEKQLESLTNRVNAYIHGEVLRPKLREALERLRKGQEALEQHAERLLVWPKVKKNRAAALEQYDRLLNQLEGYLGTLGGYEGPSAAALDDIKRIKSAFSGSQDEFSNLIDDLLMNLDKSSMLRISGECGRVIETLRIAFRR